MTPSVLILQDSIANTYVSKELPFRSKELGASAALVVYELAENY